jgi:cytochrome d ubiquinol oxidase subunit II
VPNPLAKEALRPAHPLFDISRAVHSPMAEQALGVLGPIAAAALSAARRPGLGFTANALGMVGIIGSAGLSMFPFIMPSSIDPRSSLTIWDAPSSHLTLTVMFVAVVILLPIVLGYTIWCYANMWGRVTAEGIEAESHSAY